MYNPTFMVYIHFNKYLAFYTLTCSIYNLELSKFPNFVNIIFFITAYAISQFFMFKIVFTFLVKLSSAGQPG